MLLDISDAKHSENPAISHVITGENSNFGKNLNDEKMSTILFSPPYANSFDYFEIFKLELWMGEFIKDYAEFPTTITHLPLSERL